MVTGWNKVACEDSAGGLSTLSDAVNGAEKTANPSLSPLSKKPATKRKGAHELWTTVRDDVFSGNYARAKKRDSSVMGWGSLFSAFGIDMDDNSDDKETTLIHAKGKLLLNSEHWLYSAWWHLIVFLTYWNLFQVPFSVAFHVANPLINGIVWAVDSVFLLDILVTFSTPIHIHGREVTNRWIIAKQYLKLHFWIDLMACIPLDRIGASIAPDNPYMPLLGFSRVLRVRKLVNLLGNMEKSITVSYELVVLLKLLTLVSVLTHMEACLFWFIGEMGADNGWQASVDELSIHEQHGHGDHLITNYLIALYWSVVTYTTVGYGDLSPVNEAERAYAILVMIVNMGLSAYVLGNITMLTTQIDQSVLEYRGVVSKVAAYLKRKKLPRHVVKTALQQLETSQELAEDTDEVLEHCAPYVRSMILSSLYQNDLSRCMMLLSTSAKFVDGLARASTIEFFQPGTNIIMPKERAANFYYVLSGVMQTMNADAQPLRVIKKGFAFGGEGVFCEVPQYYGVKALTLVKVLVVSHRDVIAICNQYPADHRRVCTNLLNKFQNMKPTIATTEKADIDDMCKKIKSHLHNLKTEMVTQLCYFASDGDISALKTMLNNDTDHDINEGDYDGRRPLHIAAACGSTEIVHYIIDKCNADVNVVDRFGGTPLHDAVKHNHVEAAAAIRAAGGELMLPDAGCTLCTLVMEGGTETLAAYLENGADPNAADYDMRTPLHIACAEGLISTVKILLNFGADINFMDRFGTTPLDEAEHGETQITVKSYLDEVTEVGVDGTTRISVEKLNRYRSSLAPRSTASITEAVDIVRAATEGGVHESSKDELYAKQKEALYSNSQRTLMNEVTMSNGSFSSSAGGVIKSVKYCRQNSKKAGYSMQERQASSGIDRYTRSSSLLSSRKISEA